MRLLATSEFDASLRGRAILGFMLGEMLANRQESLNLATIARQVFRRGEDFNPHLDPAVRIEIARVRRALDRYYRLSGATNRSTSAYLEAPSCRWRAAWPARRTRPPR